MDAFAGLTLCVDVRDVSQEVVDPGALFGRAFARRRDDGANS
jgi:hypothetical protein